MAEHPGAQRTLLSASSPWTAYAEAVLYVALAFMARLLLEPALHGRSPLLFFTVPVLAVAARNGVGPASTASLLGAAAGVWAFMGQRYSFSGLSIDEWANVGSFAVTSTGIIFIADRLRSARLAEASTAEATRAAAAELRGSEERYRAIVETAVDAVVVIDEAGTIQSFNPAAERIFGYTAEEVAGQNVRLLMDEGHSRGHDQYIQSYVATSERKIIGIGREVEGRRRDGSTFPLDLSIAEWRSGEQRFFTGVMRDVTERKRAERQVRESEDRLRRVLDQLFAFVGIMELDGTLLEANRAPLEIAGIKAEDVLGRPLWQAYWWSYDEGVQTRLRQAIAQAAAGETVRYDVPIRVAGGALTTIDLQIAPLRDAEGRVTHLVPSAIPVEERVRAQADLERRVAQLRSVYDGVPVGLAFHDRDLRFLEINGALAAINGRPVEDHLGRSVTEVLPETAADIVPIQRRVIDTGEPMVGIEVRTQTAASAGERDYLVSYVPARDAAQEVVGLTVAVLDITDRKAAEAAVRQGEQRFRTLAEAIPALVFASRDRGNTYVNARYAEYTGLTMDELLGDGWKRVLHPDDVALLDARTSARDQANGALELELRLRRADGQWRWHIVRSMSHPTEPGLSIGAMFDIHDRREAETRLAESETRYRTLIESIDAGFSLVELSFDETNNPLDYRFVEVNPAFERQTGLASVVGRRVRELMPNLEAHWFETYGRVALSGEPVRFENGSEVMDRWFDVYAVPVGQQAPYRVGILFNDISDRRRAEVEVRRLNRNLELLVEERTKRLETTIADLDAFAYTVSHDLRAPLRGIEGFARILNEEHAEELGPTGQRYAKRIFAAAERMDQLIQDLLSYSRLSRVDVDLKRVDLGAMIDHVVEDHQALIETAGAQVIIEKPLPEVVGNRVVLGQIFSNLVTNALKFVEQGKTPHLRIHAEQEAGRVRVWVDDNGIGIDPEFRDKIFNVFERLHGQEHYSGTGIGLAIVKKGAERLGGAAGVEPNSKGGSRFWVELLAAGERREA